MNRDTLKIIFKDLSKNEIIKIYETFKLDIPPSIVKNMVAMPPKIKEIMDGYNQTLGNNRELYYQCSYFDAAAEYYRYLSLSNGLIGDRNLFDDFQLPYRMRNHMIDCEAMLIYYIIDQYTTLIENDSRFEENDDGVFFLDGKQLDFDKLDNYVNNKHFGNIIRNIARCYIIDTEGITYSNILKDQDKLISKITDYIIDNVVNIFV